MEPFEIVIPCRNAPEILWLTLTHLLAYGPTADIAQATLIDNQSTAPGSREVLEFARRAGFNVILNEKNIGVWASVNRGLALARTRWVAVVTSDVLLGPSVLEAIVSLTQRIDCPFLGPEVGGLLGMAAVPRMAPMIPDRVEIDTSTYNGACWVMDWPRLKKTIGYFDPQFYVCAGDTDYVERMWKANLSFGVAVGLPCVHLDKQTRRHDGDVRADTEMEIQDLGRFREKWKDAPEVLIRHPLPDLEGWNVHKGGAEGWKAAIPT